MTKEGDRTITASWVGDDTVASRFDVLVAPGAPMGLAILDTPMTATVGDVVTVNVAAVDAYGNPFGDLSSQATFSSSVATDVFSTEQPNRVALGAPGEHVITATYPGLDSATITISVTSSPAADLPDPAPGQHVRPEHDLDESGGEGSRRLRAGGSELAATGPQRPNGAIAVGVGPSQREPRCAT